MREIKSNRFLNKLAIYGRDLPVGDPGLPGNLRERDIPQGFDTYEEDLTGESEVANYLVEYNYTYDFNDDYANNIQIIKAKSYGTGEIIASPDFLYRLQEKYDDQIREDIEYQVESKKIQRQSGHGDPEYDHEDQF